MEDFVTDRLNLNVRYTLDILKIFWVLSYKCALLQSRRDMAEPILIGERFNISE